jgi:histidinol-phosphatase (PHP family)
MRFPIGDSHVHTNHSVDAKGSVHEFCQRAFELGLYEITFTNHYEIMPSRKDRMGYFILGGERIPAGPDSVKRMIEELREAGETFFPAGLKVRVGLEVGWDIRLYDRLAKELREFDLDFVIGSVHDIDDEPILERAYAPQFFQSRPIEAWIEKYFQKAGEIADSGLFNVIAHLDVYKRYGLVVYGDVLREAHKPYLSDLFVKMKKSDLALEVNTSGIRHGIGEYYPSVDILNEARRAEVFVAGLGSDAHAPDQLALDFESAIALVPEILPCDLEEGYGI